MDDFSLPGYHVEELVGFGGSSEVWRARDASTGEVVALKRLRADAASATSARQLERQAQQRQLQREAALLATVRHDHIVALRSVVSTSDGLVLVLDYAEGGSLAALLGVRGQLSAGEVVTIGAPLAQALADIHARGLTHGDVTPGNIVFDRSGKPLLADLGVAKLVGYHSGPIGRTPGYADPTPGGGPASDLHGLAAVCFAALAGVPPYSDAEPMVARALGPLAIDVPAELVAAIESGLDPDPAARPDPAAFGRAVFASCPPVAVRLARGSLPATATATTHVVPGAVRAADVPPDPDPRHTSRLRRGRSVGRHRWSAGRRVLVGRVVAASCVVALLGAAVIVGMAWGWADHGHGAAASVPVASASVAVSAGVAAASASGAVAPLATPASAPVGSVAPVSAEPDWLAVLSGLDRSRDAAFADADANELDAVYVPGSAALATDRATLGRLVGAGQRVRGLQFVLESVRLVSQSSGDVTLAVVDTLAGYDVVDAAGVATPVAGRGARKWTVVLHGPDGIRRQWLIASIAPA